MKKAIAFVLCLLILGSCCMVYASQEDKTVSDWAADEVKAASGAGLDVDALGDDLTADITRGEFCILIDDALTKTSSIPVPETVANLDRDFYGEYYPSKIADLYERGVIKGVAEGDLALDDTLTREQAATFICRALENIKIVLPELMDDYPYSDVSDISAWALDPIRLLYGTQIMNGTGGFNFSPKLSYTKEQATATVYRMMEYINKVMEATMPQTDKASFEYALAEKVASEGNWFVSPFSVKAALAMAANGAAGDTQSQILSTLGVDDLTAFNKTVRGLIDLYKDGRTIELNITDSLWLNTDRIYDITGFKKSFADTVSKYYDAAAENVTDKDAVSKVNAWVKAATNGKIDTVIDDPEFSAIIANAIYFGASWAQKFESDATHKDDFTNADGSTTKTDFMAQTAKFNYYSADGVTILELPYADFNESVYEEGKDVSMFIIDADKLADAKTLLDTVELKSAKVALKMPKFKVENSLSLKQTLIDMGITDAFNEKLSDLTPMFDGGNAYFDDVIHKTYIDVTEDGTEAAAVTAIIMCEATAFTEPEPIIDLTLDHPFMYVIRENTTGEILFMGMLNSMK